MEGPNILWKSMRSVLSLAFVLALVGAAQGALASDHLDTPRVIADPRADIGDLYAWISPDGRRLNVALPIVGHDFSDRLTYAVHIESGPRYGATTAAVALSCRFKKGETECRLGRDLARGLGDTPHGLVSRSGRFRVFAGLRDDPFFNNVRGTRAAYDIAAKALQAGAITDAAGCPAFAPATVEAIRDQWSHTAGGAPQNLLAGWTPASIVAEIDLRAVTRGGPILALWATTASSERQIDRAGRVLTGNALLGTIAGGDESNRLKEAYNAATPADGERFVAEIEKGLALYDGFDGLCGNQLLAGSRAEPHRYRALARMLADDRLWLNSAAPVCTTLMSVETAALAGWSTASDCGGRAPSYNAVNLYRSLLVAGDYTAISDGLSRDEKTLSDADFPFLSPPSPHGQP